MTRATDFAAWFDIRPSEGRRVVLAFAGAFLILAFVILSRALRETFFLSSYAIRYLPWMTVAVVMAGLPAIAVFGRMLRRSRPSTAVRWVIVVEVGGLCLLGFLLPRSPAAVLIFYLWTAVGTLLLTSGFWVVIAELFDVRGAKRLFGLIVAGGTAGAMTMGLSLSGITGHFGLTLPVFLAALLLLLLLMVLGLMPSSGREVREGARDAPPLFDSVRLIRNDSHLRTVAGLVFTATVTTTLIDYLFKEFARATYGPGAELAGFFGSFYGWSGGVALLIQVGVAGRLLSGAGIATVLMILPLVLIGGGVGLLVAPGMLMAVLLRGADYSLRKSLYRPAVELLFVPLSARIRRQTKTLLDSVLDSSAEGFGSAVILIWVAGLNLPSRYLAALVILTAVVYGILSRRMGRRYLQTVATRLREEAAGSDPSDRPAELPTRALLRATFTHLDLGGVVSAVERAVSDPTEPPADPVTSGQGRAESNDDLDARLASRDDDEVLQALADLDTLNSEQLEAVIRLLARDSLCRPAVELLQRFPDESAPRLVELLRTEDADFVIRRRIPEILAGVGDQEVDDALIDALTCKRFEVRYRSGVALATRRRLRLTPSRRAWRERVWHAVSQELRRGRSLWEVNKLLDDFEVPGDDLAAVQLGIRGERSLEHTFRLLTLVLDPQHVQAAYHGILLGDGELKAFALEYLELVLPSSVRHHLWLVIGDISEQRRARQLRPVDAVVEDLMDTRQTMFGGQDTRLALRKILIDREDPSVEDAR